MIFTFVMIPLKLVAIYPLEAARLSASIFPTVPVPRGAQEMIYVFRDGPSQRHREDTEQLLQEMLYVFRVQSEIVKD